MTDNFDRKLQVDGPVVNAGELGSSTFSPGQALPAGPLGLGQRWTAARKREVVLRRVTMPVQLLSRQLGVGSSGSSSRRGKRSRDRRLAQATQGRSGEARGTGRAMKRIGELTMQVELPRPTCGDLRPFGAAEVAAMSRRHSPGGLAYGLRRVCAAWGMARSSFYAMTSGRTPSSRRQQRRGPKPAISDQALLVAIEARPGSGIALGGRGLPQGLRLGFEGLSRHPGCPQAGAGLMREAICSRPIAAAAVAAIPMTVRSSLMPRTSMCTAVRLASSRWTTAGAVFTAVEHWNAECVGWHVCKRGDRFAALQPISMGLAGLYGSIAAGAAGVWPCGWNHGSQYLSDHFTNHDYSQVVVGHPAVRRLGYRRAPTNGVASGSIG